MSRKKTEQTGSFVVTTDDDEQVEVFIWTDFIDASSMGKPNKWIEGNATLLTADGVPVNSLGDDAYEILYSTGAKKARKVGS